jgi:hypothetical protein
MRSLSHRRQLVFAAVVATLAIACSSSEPTAPSVADLHPLLPSWWGPVGTNSTAYSVGTVHQTRHGGSTALVIVGQDTSKSAPGLAGIGQYIRADNYRGRRIRLRGWVRQAGITGPDIGLWLRIDGPGITEGLDNFSSRPLTGTADWHQVESILDVPNDALGIAFGAQMSGKGEFFIDDLTLDVVPATGATTNQLQGFVVSEFDSTTWAKFYGRQGAAPVNLDFETP